MFWIYGRKFVRIFAKPNMFSKSKIDRLVKKRYAKFKKKVWVAKTIIWLSSFSCPRPRLMLISGKNANLVMGDIFTIQKHRNTAQFANSPARHIGKLLIFVHSLHFSFSLCHLVTSSEKLNFFDREQSSKVLKEALLLLLLLAGNHSEKCKNCVVPNGTKNYCN